MNVSKVKERYFDFDRIKLLFQKSRKENYRQVIPDEVCDDLDFEELFMYLDKTSSRPGQQLFYRYLRTVPLTKDRIDVMENMIDDLSSRNRSKIKRILSRLNQDGSYYLPDVFLSSHSKKPNWYPVLPVLSGLTVLTIILSFFSSLALLFLLGIILINSFFHF